MKFYFGILFLLTACFVASPTSNVQACSDAGATKGQKNNVANTNDAHCVTIDDNCVDTHPGQDCPPDTDGCGHCHCPGCCTNGGMTYSGFFKHNFTELPESNWSYNRRASNFCYNAPSTSAHLTTLFQPPRV